MTDPRVLIAVIGAFGVVIILLLLRGGPEGFGGSAFSLSGIRAALEGKKTYIVGVALLTVDQLADLGWVTDLTAGKIEKVLLVIAAFTLKAAQNRVENGQARIEVRQKVAAIKTEEVKQAVEQAVEQAAPVAVTPKRVEVPAEPVKVVKDSS
jgi:hypothetical protein